jgi:hypothetical protein
MKNQFFFLFFILISCQPQIETVGEAQVMLPSFKVNPPINNCNVDTNVFLIDNSKDTTLISDKGGFISIPSNCFKNKKGQLVKENIKVQFNEYLTPSDILLSGIPMVFMEGEDTMNFQSAGMCKIVATDENNESLNLMEGKSIDIGLRNMAQDEDYNLYYFDTLKGNWIEKQKELNVVNKPLPIVPVTLNDINPKRILSIHIENYKFRPLYKMWHKSKFKVYGRQSFVKSDSTVWWYDMRIDSTLNPDLYKVTFIGVDENSKQRRYSLIIQPTINQENYDIEMQNFKTNMLAYVESIELAKIKQLQIVKEIKLQNEQVKKQLIVDSLNLIIQNREDSIAFIDSQKKELAKVEVMRVFSVNKMGIYNCDRFYKKDIIVNKRIKMIVNDNVTFFDNAYLISSVDNAVLNYIPRTYESYMINMSNKDYDFIGVKQGVIYHSKINNLNSNFNKTQLTLSEVPLKNLKNLLD